MTVRRGKGGTFYRTPTLTLETKEQYEKVYGYDAAHSYPLRGDSSDSFLNFFKPHKKVNTKYSIGTVGIKISVAREELPLLSPRQRKFL